MSWLSRERQEAIVKKIVADLKTADDVTFEEDPETVRRRLNRVLAESEKAHTGLVTEAERKVGQLKRRVPEGSAEWDLLIRKYLDEEYQRIDRYSIKS